MLDAIINRLNSQQVKSVPFVILDLINGNHAKYVSEVLDGYLKGDAAISLGMRYSVYCSEQIAYSNPILEKKQDLVLPWFSGYPFNNVNHSICDCWKVKPENEIAKRPVYSKVPALISSGDIDPDCRPFYNELIKRYMPNAQLMIIHNKGHAAGFTVDGVDYVKIFLDNPDKTIISQSKNLIIK